MVKEKYFIIGSLKQEDKIIKLSSEKYSDSKHVYSDPNKSFIELVKAAFDNIDKADTIVVVRKPDGSIGEGTTYESEYAKRMGKNIIYED